MATKKAFQISAVSISTSVFIHGHIGDISDVQDTCVLVRNTVQAPSRLDEEGGGILLGQ